MDNYNSEKYGKIKFSPKLTDYDIEYFIRFYSTLHNTKSEKGLSKDFTSDYSYGGDFGDDGKFYVRQLKTRRSQHDNALEFSNVVDPNKPAHDTPSLYCPFYPSLDGKYFYLSENEHDIEKVIKWIYWLKKYFFHGKYTLDGEIIVKGSNKSVVIKKSMVFTKRLDNNDALNTNFTKFVNNKELKDRNDLRIINRLIKYTKDGDIKWTKNGKYEVYKTNYYVKDTMKLIFYLENESKLKLNIYIQNDRKLEYYKGIKISKLKKLYYLCQEKVKEEEIKEM